MVVYEGDMTKPKVSLKIPIVGLKFADKFLPEQARNELDAQGIDLSTLLGDINELEPITLLDVNENNKHVIIELE